METSPKIRSAIENDIRASFRGVTLGRGISIRQAELADLSDCRVSRTPSAEPEVTDDWSRVDLAELERDGIAHLDALGFRYYIAPLMLSVINHYEPSSMRVIGTLGGLYPKRDDSWAYHAQRYSLLTLAQKAAIARFLAALPKLVELDPEYQKIVERALRNYWGQYLKKDTSE